MRSLLLHRRQHIATARSDEESYKLRAVPSQAEHNDHWDKVRSYIWEHWNAGRPATLTTEHFTKEGERVAAVYEIVVAVDGVKILRISTRLYLVGRNRQDAATYRKPLEVTSEYKVERIERKESLTRPGGFRLLLSDGRGSLIREI